MPVTRPRPRVLPETPHRTAVRLVTGHFDQYAGYHVYRARGTTDWLLTLTLNGLGRFGFTPDGKEMDDEILSSPGDLVLLRTGTLHDYGVEASLSHWEFLWTHFNPRADWLAWLDWPAVAPGLMRLRLGTGDDFRRLAARFHDVHRHATGARARRDALAMNALEELLLWCDDLNPRTGLPRLDERIQRALDFIAAHLQTPVTLSRLADLVALSESRFAHLFRDQTGTTPQQFLETRRLDRAATLLLETQLSVKEIARQVGYVNPFYFTQRFTRKEGKSPTRFRHDRLLTRAAR